MNRRTLLSAIAATLAFPLSGRAATLPPVQQGKGMVVFYRPRMAKGGAIRFRISGNSDDIGNLANGSMLAAHVTPGQHGFHVATPSVAGADSISLAIRAGETVFVKGEMRLGWPAGRARFVRVSPEQGRAEVAQMP